MVQGVGGSGGGVEGLGFGFGSVWLRDLGMQLCFGFGSDVFAKLHIYLIYVIYVSFIYYINIYATYMKNDVHI